MYFLRKLLKKLGIYEQVAKVKDNFTLQSYAELERSVNLSDLPSVDELSDCESEGDNEVIFLNFLCYFICSFEDVYIIYHFFKFFCCIDLSYTYLCIPNRLQWKVSH